jgi:hypothetical protein
MVAIALRENKRAGFVRQRNGGLLAATSETYTKS